jgi:FtsZ-interacting cell division protein ZipA
MPRAQEENTVETSTIIWIVVAVVVVVVALAALGAMRRRRSTKTEAARKQAGALRQEAAGGAAGLQASQAEAQRARAEADAAAARAREAEQRAGMTEAQVEDRVREADRVDPDVDHRSDEYRPEFPAGTDDRRDVRGDVEGRPADPDATRPPEQPEAHAQERPTTENGTDPRPTTDGGGSHRA